MPYIHIKSLPMPDDKDPAAVLEPFAKRFCKQAGIDQRHLTVTWAYFQPQHYLCGEDSGQNFDPQRHQLLVDLLVPDFNDPTTVETMMHSIASTVEQILKLPKACLFINTRYAASGMVMDAGKIVRW